jgi:hypothetical protein
MDILLLFIIAYCIYLHYRIVKLPKEDTSVILELIDEVCDLQASVEINAKELKKAKNKKCCNEKPRRRSTKKRRNLS